MALVSKVRTYSICLSSGTSALASFTAGGSLPDSLPSGLRYWRYSISNFAAMVIAILVLGGIGAGPDRARPRVRGAGPDGRAGGGKPVPAASRGARPRDSPTMIPAGAKTAVARCGSRRWGMDGRQSLPPWQERLQPRAFR